MIQTYGNGHEDRRLALATRCPTTMTIARIAHEVVIRVGLGKASDARSQASVRDLTGVEPC
jgi:hypothetical protein